MVPYKFSSYLFSFVKNAIGVLTRMALNLQMALGGTDVLTRLRMGWENTLAVDEHDMSPHSFVSFPGSFIGVCGFQCVGLSPSWLGLGLSILFFLMQLCMGLLS